MLLDLIRKMSIMEQENKGGTGRMEKSHRKGDTETVDRDRGRRKEDGRQGTDHVRQRAEDTGDKEQRRKTGERAVVGKMTTFDL